MASVIASATQQRGHAVVIGAGMGGLLAARVLSDVYARVTVIDRGEPPVQPDARQGVPQGGQMHALLAGGAAALDELFPGFSRELVVAGAPSGDGQADMRWYLDGHLLQPAVSGLIGMAPSRPLVEHGVCTRVAALAGIEIIGSCDAVGLTTTADRARVTGVRVRSRRGGEAAATMAADLVVDAGGRNSRSPVWLRELGYPQVPVSEVRTDVVYVTRHYRYEPDQLDGRLGATVAAFPGHPRMGVALRQESNRIAVLLAGMLGEEPPTDDEGMAAFADTLAGSDIAQVIRSATPVSEAVKMRHPVSLRRHYERLRRFPAGYLVIGDALCSFNPIYAQGMSVAVAEALLLGRILRAGAETDHLAQRFFRAAAKLINTPWSLGTGADLRFPQAAGERPPGVRILNGYLDRYRAATAVDPDLGAAFLRVVNMIDRPSRLLAPDLMIRVFRAPATSRRKTLVVS